MNTLPIALPLTPDACSDCRDRCLAIEISDSAIHVLTPGHAGDVYARIALGDAGGRWLKAVEEAVYANPLLLCDFRSVSVLLRTRDAMPVPADFGAWLPCDTDCECVCENVATLAVDVQYACRSELLKFLRRSFNNPSIGCHLSRLCDFFGRLSRRSNRQRAYVQYVEGCVDVVVFSPRELQLAASYRADCAADAIYFALAACDAAGFDRSEGEMMLIATGTFREALQPLLRRYVNYVMPLIIPADFNRQAPLELALAARPNSNN